MLFVPASLHAANRCPWLTEGSAAAALGGDVVSTVQLGKSGEGTCTFSREHDGAKDTLKIRVQESARAMCPAGSQKLSGIGDEAVACALRRSGESVAIIESRVRELHFQIALTIHTPKARSGDESPNRNGADSAIEQIAEQVAGNLF